MVIRAALQLLFSCLKNNPFSPKLATERFSTTLANLEEQLKALGPGPRGEGDEEDEGGEGEGEGEEGQGDVRVSGGLGRGWVLVWVGGWVLLATLAHLGEQLKALGPEPRGKGEGEEGREGKGGRGRRCEGE